MKVGICGHFGGKEVFLDGQTVKTKNVYSALCDSYGSENVFICDTYKIKERFVVVFFGLIDLFFRCDSIIMLPARNGVRIFTPLFSFLKFLLNKKIYYCVIGGWLSDFLSDKAYLSECIKKFDGVLVESQSMKTSLEGSGFLNVVVLPNFKRLKIVDTTSHKTPSEPPYKLCTFSRVMKEKGIEDAINAVVKANEILNTEAFVLDIYGQIDAGYEERFSELMSCVPNCVNYKGCIPHDMSTSVLSSYYALLFPTYYEGEGFAGTLLDAFASGLPVIASDWKYNGELVSSDVGVIFESKTRIYNLEYDIPSMRTNCIKKAHIYSFDNAVKSLAAIIG